MPILHSTRAVWGIIGRLRSQEFPDVDVQNDGRRSGQGRFVANAAVLGDQDRPLFRTFAGIGGCAGRHPSASVSFRRTDLHGAFGILDGLLRERIELSILTNEGVAPSVRNHACDRSRESPASEGPVERGITKREDASVAGDHPVPAAVWR